MDVLCGEVYLTLMGDITFHCILCDDKYNGFQEYAKHIKNKHYPNFKNSINKESESLDIHDNQTKTNGTSIIDHCVSIKKELEPEVETENNECFIIDQYPAIKKEPLFMIEEVEELPTKMPTSGDISHEKDTEPIDIIKSEYELTEASHYNIRNERITDDNSVLSIEDGIINDQHTSHTSVSPECTDCDFSRNAMRNHTKRHKSSAKDNEVEITPKKAKLLNDVPSMMTATTDDSKLKCGICSVGKSDYRDGTFSKPGRPSSSDKEERLNGKLHILRLCEDVKSKDCSVCSNRKISGGRRQTNYFCDTCSRKPGLHIGDCFERYHRLKNYKI